MGAFSLFLRGFVGLGKLLVQGADDLVPQMGEEEDNILDFYKEEYPDNYEVTEDEEEASWCCSCKDSPMFDELVLTEKEVE